MWSGLILWAVPRFELSFTFNLLSDLVKLVKQIVKLCQKFLVLSVFLLPILILDLIQPFLQLYFHFLSQSAFQLGIIITVVGTFPFVLDWWPIYAQRTSVVRIRAWGGISNRVHLRTKFDLQSLLNVIIVLFDQLWFRWGCRSIRLDLLRDNLRYFLCLDCLS